MTKELSGLGLVRHWFGDVGAHARKCTMDELKALSKEERDELADGIVAEGHATKVDDGKYLVEA